MNEFNIIPKTYGFMAVIFCYDNPTWIQLDDKLENFNLGRCLGNPLDTPALCIC